MKPQYSQNKFFQDNCNRLLKIEGVRYAGVINNMGKQIAGGYKNSIIPLVDDEEHKISLEHALEIMITKDLDEPLGSIENIVTTRKKVIMITIPFEKFSILISAEKESNPNKIMKKAWEVFGLN